MSFASTEDDGFTQVAAKPTKKRVSPADALLLFACEPSWPTLSCLAVKVLSREAVDGPADAEQIAIKEGLKWWHVYDLHAQDISYRDENGFRQVPSTLEYRNRLIAALKGTKQGDELAAYMESKRIVLGRKKQA